MKEKAKRYEEGFVETLYNHLREYVGKEIGAKVRGENKVYRGKLREVEKSFHGGIGSVYLEKNDGEWMLIRGNEICLIILED